MKKNIKNAKKTNYKKPLFSIGRLFDKIGLDLNYSSKNKRFYYAAFLFLMAWGFLWLRTFYIQIILGPSYAMEATNQHTYTELVEARRGTIYDRNGQVLAQSIQARSIYANPRAMEDPQTIAKELAVIIDGDEEKLSELFLRDRAFVWVQRKVDDATAKAVQDAKLQGISLSREYDRIYPQQHLAGQLLGFVGLDNHGLEGIERSFNEELTGEAHRRLVYRDGEGRRYYMENEGVPKGQDLHLTIDGQMQFIAEDVIARAAQNVQAKWGGVLIVEVESGDILAWAQYPFFNPNTFRSSSPEIYRNRIASDALEPGSTLKAFPVAAALEEDIITPESIFFNENGVWETENIVIGDDGRSYGDLPVNKIIRYSSNIGVAKIGLELGKDKYYDYLSRLGFGERTNVGVGESKGILRDPKEWSKVDLMSASFGQSVAVTGLQMAQAYLTLANNGISKPLRLVEEKTDLKDEERIFSASTTKEIMSMLEEVVESDGTGRRARVTGVRVAGKTGTAQKAKEFSGGYGDGRFASFTGIIPADDPRYVIIIMLDEPKTSQYGGTIAAPVFKEVASRVLSYGGYLPDVVFEDNTKIAKEDPNTRYSSVQITPPKPLTEFPNLIGVNLRRALEILMPLGIEPEIRGQGINVLYQYPAPKTPIPLVDAQGNSIPTVIWLSEEENMKIEAPTANNSQEISYNTSTNKQNIE